jgi:hypothetical protein
MKIRYYHPILLLAYRCKAKMGLIQAASEFGRTLVVNTRQYRPKSIL